MAMNRRNVLIGLGAIAAGGGAAFGSGAFSQVEADRSVSITMAGDSGALLQLGVEDSYAGISDSSPTGTQGETIIDISLENINDDAVTTFEDALTITNNGNNPVDLAIDDSAVDGVTFKNFAASIDASGGTDSTSADIEVDTTGTVSEGDVTITATDNS